MAYIISSGESCDGIVLDNDSMTVLDGGIASATTVNSGGKIYVSSMGTVIRTYVCGGALDVSSGGIGSRTIVSGGSMCISYGGVANSTTVNEGDLVVSGGGGADIVNVYGIGGLIVSSGGTATNITALSTQLVFAVSLDTFIDGTSGGTKFTIKNGTISNYTVNSGGKLHVYSGGKATSTTVSKYGLMYISNGGTANYTTITPYGSVFVENGGTANSTTFIIGGSLFLKSGGTANDTTLITAAQLFVSGGGTANGTTVNSGGYFYVNSGGMANNTTVNSGDMWVAGKANSTTINGAHMDILSGGLAIDTLVNRGKLNVSSGGIASNVQINSGGSLILEGKLTGQVTIANSSVIRISKGAEIDFDISSIAPGTKAPLLNNLSIIPSVPAFTLTVSDSQWNGIYTLAKGVVSFDNLISIKSSVNGITYVAAIDDTVTVDGVEYTLNLTGDTLSVTVTGGRDIPIIPVSADNTDFTNQDVMLTAGFSDDAIMREYSFDNETWHVYTEPVKCTMNGTVYFLGKDLNGSISEMASFEISNIDNVSPEKPTISASITELTDGAVTVTAVFSEDSFVREFSLDGENWQDYKEAVELTKNGIVYFRGTDEAGNKSEIASYTVSNIRETIYNAVLVDESRIVESGWIYSNTTIENKGCLIVSSGGAAEETTVDSGGSLYVSGGGIATEIMENGGYVEVEDDTETSFVSNTFSGLSLKGVYRSATVHSGTTAVSTAMFEGKIDVYEGGMLIDTFISKGELAVSSGGTANSTTLSGGRMYISSGGVANDITAMGSSGKGPELRICSGGTATNIVYKSDGKLSIENGAVIHGITVDSGNEIKVDDKTTMTGIIENGGYVSIADGAEATFASNTFAGLVLGESGYYRCKSATVHSGTTAVSTTMLDGSMFVYEGGKAIETVISKGGLIISSGGTSIDTTVYSGGSLSISSGGTAINAIVNGGGIFFVKSGGTAENLVLSDNKGKIDIQRGAVIHGITLNSGISIGIASNSFITGIVENGGYVRVEGSAISDLTFVSNTFSGQVFSQGSATVHSGTTAFDTTITSGARIEVYESGRAVETTLNGGGITIDSGGTADSTTINSGGSMTIYSGMINSTTINSGGSMTIYSGMINSTTINSGGRVEFYGKSDMVANNTIVNFGGSFSVKYGVIASDIVENGGYVSVSNRSDATFVANAFSGVLLSNAAATVHSGTTAVKTLIDSIGKLYVYDGGVANDTTVNMGGKLIISSGGTGTGIIASNGARLELDVAPSTYIQGFYGGSAFVINDAFVANYTINANCKLNVCNGGKTVNNVVNADGELHVSSGGTATDIIWTPCEGHVYVGDGGMASFASQYSGVYYGSDNQLLSHEAVMDSKSLDGSCEMNVMSGGITTETTVNSGGYLYVSGGGIANGTTVNSNGSQYVSNGGTANSTMVNGGGLFVFSNGTASNTTVNSNGRLVVSSGGTAVSTAINFGGGLAIYSGGWATGTIVSCGYLGVNDSGFATDTEVYSDGQLQVNYRGRAINTIIYSEGLFDVYYGGKVAGRMQFESGAMVSMYEGAILDFDLTQVEAGEMALVNDLSIIQGTPLYTLTVSSTLTEGLYLLADGAAVFDQTISVVNIAGNELGTLTVGETTAIGKYTYTLALTDSALSVNVVKVLPPDKPTISVDVSLPTNGNVIISAEFSEDCVKREYALDGETWQTYIDEIVFSENGSVSFRGIDTAGKVSEIAEYEVLNIDKEPPEKPTASADITTATNKDVTVTAVFSEDSVLKEYSLDGEAWLAYTKAIILENNGIVYFRGTDEVGNTSEIASYEIVNIDRLAPEKPTVSADITTVTNKDVTVTAVFSEDSVKMEYSFDGENWLDYSGGIAFPENGTVMFRGTDAAGNASEVTSYTVDYIDRLAPEKPIVTADVTTVTKGNVKVSAEFSEDSEIKKYSLDGENWRDYTEAVEFTENGTVYFQGTDEAGNPSEIAEYTVANIDKDPPKKTIPSADITAPTNKTVTVTVSFAGDAEQAFSLYRIGEENEWHDYEENGVAITENTTVYFKAVDAAGNESEIASYTVDNIDKVAPEKPFVFASNTMLTNQDITVTAVFSEDSTVKEYSTDGQTWLSYTEPLVVSANGILLFRAKDEAGNISGLVTFEVGNIDKDVPIITLSGDNTTPLHTSTLSASTEDGLDLFYSTDKENWMKYEDQLEVTANAVYYFTATDAAGNIGTAEYEFRNILPNSVSIPQTQTWEKTDEVEQYTLEYSTDNFEHVIRLTVDSNSLASFNVPAGGIQWRVKPEGSDEWTVGEPVTAAETDNEPKLIKSDEDGNADVFFAKAVDIWESGYLAQHVGSINDWNGTNEYATVSGKNKLADIIEGSTDANILLMTDDDNGDGLFVDDIYTTLPGTVSEQQSRIAQIDEIRAGAGADIVDMTSQRFEYIGNGLTIRGGDGNDTIWANKGDNFLFGDAGNDRIVGASGNDVIAGGIGNDRMHGGGGDDVFTFFENWGVDNVEQLAGGSVTLWFASGSMENWDKTTLTYSDGNNSVKVSGVIEDQIMLKFGDDGSDQFATLSGMGAFFDATTERIFEESSKGILASL